MEYGYTRHEAMLFTRLPLKSGGYTSIVLSRPYTKLMLRDRRRLVKADIPVIPIQTTVGAWAEWRLWYLESIRRGDYIPPLQHKTHKKLMADGNIDREWVNRKARELREQKRSRGIRADGVQRH